MQQENGNTAYEEHDDKDGSECNQNKLLPQAVDFTGFHGGLLSIFQPGGGQPGKKEKKSSKVENFLFFSPSGHADNCGKGEKSSKIGKILFFQPNRKLCACEKREKIKKQEKLLFFVEQVHACGLVEREETCKTGKISLFYFNEAKAKQKKKEKKNTK